MRRGVGSARCLLRLRYLPSLQLAVDSRFSLRCWPSATKNCTPPSLWSPSDTHHQPRPRSYAARLCFRCRHSARRLSRRHPPPRLKKKSILSYYSACAVAPPGKSPLGTRFLNQFRTWWHIAQAPDRNFALVRILSTCSTRRRAVVARRPGATPVRGHHDVDP